MEALKKRIVILGDSLSLPRPDNGVNYEDTYGYLLQENNYEVLNRSRRANDTNLQLLEQNMLDDIIYLNPDVVIVYLGIVDCAPRLFTKNESRVLSLLSSGIRHTIIKIFSRHRRYITKFRRLTYVRKEEFQKNLDKLVVLLKQKKAEIIIINISNTNRGNEKRSHNFKKNIDEYNLVISKIAKSRRLVLLNMNNISNMLLDDGVHINKKAHAYIFEKITEYIRK